MVISFSASARRDKAVSVRSFNLRGTYAIGLPTRAATPAPAAPSNVIGFRPR